MKINIYFFILIISCGVSTSANNNSDINQCLKLLSELKYQEALKFSSNIEDPKTTQLINLLTTVLYNERQKKNEFTFDIESSENSIHKCLYSLAKGYHKMYNDQQSRKSLVLFKSALEYAKETQNKNLIKRALLAIIENFNNDLVHYNAQYEYFLDQYKSLVSHENENYWVYCYNIRFSSQRDGNDATPYIKEQTQKLKLLVEELEDNHPYRANYYSYQGYCFETGEQFQNAIQYYIKAIKISKDIPHLKYIAFRSAIRLSEIERKRKDYKNAINYLLESKKYIDKSDTITGLHYVSFYASANYDSLKNYKKAYQHFKKAYDYEHKLNTIKNSIENSNLSIQLKTAEKEKQNLILQSEVEEEQRQQRNLWTGGIITVLFISVTGLLLFKNTKRKQRIAEQEREIEIQKTEKILKEQELTTINAMIEGQEKERQRLASDLHDSVGATLSAARLQFEHLQKHKGSLQNEEELFSKTGELLEEAYQEVRSMAHVKNNGVIAKKGLLPAIEKLVKSVSVTNKLKIEVQDFGLTERIDNSLEITIFRIIQELVTNIIKHADASEASISLTQLEDTINIIVEDNGKGFNVRKIVNKEQGMGLSSIEKRIEHLEGSMEVDATPGKGTNILIDIPL